ncbi:MAG: metalloregulator ArsR/SmtB family transcription factor [Nitrospirota bacterium]|nr:metalloregulator ArsR/SmtB family transcription factor [Nitrospirota bacterium]
MSSNCMSDVSDEKLERGARCIKTLAHPLRLKIIAVMGDGEMAVGEIVECAGTSQSNVSQHLNQLRDKGVLAARRDGNQVFYRVRDPKLFDLLGMVRDMFCDPQGEG